MKLFNEIRKANHNDLKVVIDLYEKCTQHLIKSGLDQWDDSYPSQDIIREDISKNEMWIYENGDDIGTIILNEFQDLQYSEVTWIYNENPILVIHRLAVHPNSQGKGIGKYLCLFAENYAIKNSYKSIRLDAYSINPKTNALYDGLGYRKTKETVFFDGPKMPVNCFEKKL